MIMADEDLISLEMFCTQHNVEVSFMTQLQQAGLIQTQIRDKSLFVPVDALPTLEKIIRLHYDLDINLEGVETILHLLDRMNVMRSEMTILQNRLRQYED